MGILLTIAAGFWLAGMDALGKHLMQDFHPMQAVWARYLFHTSLVGLAFGMQNGWGFLQSRQPALQQIRALCLLVVSLGMYFSIRSASLADATAILFFAPVLLTLLADLLLKEKTRSWHWWGVLIAFIGVLTIVQPGFNDTNPSLLLTMLAAIALAFYFVLTRKLKGLDSERSTLFYCSAVGSLLLCALVPIWWITPSTVEWLYLISTGIIGATGHFMLIRAFHLAPATTLSPFLNFQLAAATLYSVLFFDDQLSLSFAIGTSMIVGAGLWVWYRDKAV